MQQIVIIGGGGHSRVLIEIIKLSGQYEISGILDQKLKAGTSISGIPLLGSDEMLNELYARGVKNACIAIGSIKSNNKRRMLYERVKHIGFSVPYLIHPKAIVSQDICISEGAQIMAGAIIQADSSIGENTIINTGSIIEHDCKICSHTHICSGAVIAGGCVVGDGAFVGAGATVIQGIRIGNNAVIAAGAVVINDVPDGSIVRGVPAK